MRNINNLIALREEIALLQLQKDNNILALKQEAKITYESLKLINLLKSIFKELITTPDLKDGLINSSLGLSAGYLTKKLVFGATHNPLKQLIGILLQSTVTNVVAKNGDEIKTGIFKLIHNLINSSKEPKQMSLNLEN